MSEDSQDQRTIDYPALVVGALRSAISQVFHEVAEHGLPGDHHFYVTFRTDAVGVEMPTGLRREYPEEITIVLQNQFWNLIVDDEGFSVMLRFGGQPTALRVPFAALTAFADPSVEFGVQLSPPDTSESADPAGPGDPGRVQPEGGSKDALAVEDPQSEAAPPNGDGGTVIEFDRGRRKKS